MARRRIPPAIARALDAEARAFLERQKLPAWIGLYRFPNKTGESIVWQGRATFLDAARRGQPSTLEGHRPLFSAIIDDPERLEPAARYIMRLWMAKHRQRLAIKRLDLAAVPEAKRAAEEAVKAAKQLWDGLLAHRPSMDRGARNIAGRNAERDAKRRAEWARWQAEADAIRKQNPDLKLTNTERARRVHRQLDLGADVKVGTIRKRIV